MNFLAIGRPLGFAEADDAIDEFLSNASRFRLVGERLVGLVYTRGDMALVNAGAREKKGTAFTVSKPRSMTS